jgi:hypothetical protein
LFRNGAVGFIDWLDVGHVTSYGDEQKKLRTLA